MKWMSGVLFYSEIDRMDFGVVSGIGLEGGHWNYFPRL